MFQRISVLDTHTGGEPTRVVVSGGPDLGDATMDQRKTLFCQRYDHYRRAIVNEPRGSDVLVGAILVRPTNPDCAAGVIFFNNVGYLGMCGHGTIGVGVALGYLGRIGAGRHLLETPVGIVPFEYDGQNTVSLENVPSYRTQTGVRLQVAGLGEIVGDVAWGGNWFFLVNKHGERLAPDNVERLTDVTWRIRQELVNQGITGSQNAEIDHVELFGPATSPEAQSKNFVLCPGKAYDRSPCGTGTSAKLACLAAEGKLAPGEIWIQESIVGSLFWGSYRREGEVIIPTIRGSAHVTGEANLILDESDPFCWGVS